jgi:hypothetical protein
MLTRRVIFYIVPDCLSLGSSFVLTWSSERTWNQVNSYRLAQIHRRIARIPQMQCYYYQNSAKIKPASGINGTWLSKSGISMFGLFNQRSIMNNSHHRTGCYLMTGKSAELLPGWKECCHATIILSNHLSWEHTLVEMLKMETVKNLLWDHTLVKN